MKSFLYLFFYVIIGTDYSLTQTGVWLPAKGLYGGDVRSITLDPSDDNIIYCSLFDGGLYKTKNGGLDWEKVDIPIYFIDKLILHPDLPNVQFIIAPGAIYRSIDYGKNWKEVFDNNLVFSLVFNPLNNNTLYAGSNMGYIYKSIDCGQHWQELHTGSSSGVMALAISPTDTNIIFAGISGGMDFRGDGIYKSSDGGLTWYNDSLLNLDVNVLAVDPLSPEIIIAGTEEGIYTSFDCGLNWEPTNDSIPDKYADVYSLSFINNKPHHLLAVFNSGIYHTYIPSLVWESIESGLSFSPKIVAAFNHDTSSFLVGSHYGLLKGNYIENKFILMGVQPVAIKSFTFYTSQPDVIYASGDGVFKSNDGGDTWDLYNNGMGYGDVIYMNPANPNHLYAGQYNNYGGLYISLNAGLNWSKILEHVGINDIAIPASLPQIIYTGGLASLRTGGLFRSRDSGTSWDTLSYKINYAVVYSIETHPVDPNIILVGTQDQGLFKTIDGGDNWFQINSGLPIGDPNSDFIKEIKYDPQDTSIIYISLGVIGIYKTTNSGNDWQQINKGLTNLDVRTIFIDPDNSNVIYAGTWHGGVFKSHNGGNSWQGMNEGWDSEGLDGITVRDLILHSETENTLIAATGSGIWKYELDPVNVEEQNNTFLKDLYLHQNYPNPFNSETNFGFSVPFGRDIVKNGQISSQRLVTLKVYDLLGREVTTVVNEVLTPGNYKYQWNAGGLTSGVYLYRIQSGIYSLTKKMVLLK